MSSIPELGSSPEKWHGNPLQYSYLENPMDRGALWATVHRVTKSPALLKRLSMHACSNGIGYVSNWDRLVPRLLGFKVNMVLIFRVSIFLEKSINYKIT